MLPFLKKNRQPGISYEYRKPDTDPTQEPASEKDETDQALEACAKDLLTAIDSRNIGAIAEVLRCAHDLCQSMSSDEETESTDFAAQNEKATKDIK